MNAPWKPTVGMRDPFCAYVTDDATLDAVRALALEYGWSPERACTGALRDAVQALSVAASPTVLLVDLSHSADPLLDIQSLAEVCEPGTAVIALGQVNDVRLYRGIIASGIHDYLLKPVTPAQLREAIDAALAAIAAPARAEPDSTTQHCGVAVIGTRGGAGASTLATSLAWLFAAEHARATALLDLDVHFGTGALAVDLEPGRGLIDAIETPGRIDGLFLERATIRAHQNLAILSAEAPIARPLLSDGSAFGRLAEEFRQACAITVIDLPRAMMMNFPQLVAEANVVVLAAELTLASARDAIRLLAWLRANAPGAEIIVAATKVLPAPEISRADFAASIETEVAYLVAYDAKAAASAAQLGRPLVAAAPASKPALAIGQLAAAVLTIAGDGEVAAPAQATPSLLGRFDVRAMLGRKRGSTSVAPTAPASGKPG